jgi:glycosyltransferase involved in cell wall biosynthesis
MLSFIIPTWQEEKVIAETINKLRDNFNLVPYEIIISDNQSTDNTLRNAGALADKIAVAPAGNRQTIGTSRNRGAALAQYEYLVFLDSGVIIPDINNFFKKAIKCFEESPRLLGLTTNVKILPEVATRADRFFCTLVDLWYRFNNNFTHIGIAYGKFQMVKASAFNQIGGFNETLAAGEDAELFYKLSKLGRTRLEPSLTVYHAGRRMHQIGWPRLLLIWAANAVWVLIFKRAISKEWKAVR